MKFFCFLFVFGFVFAVRAHDSVQDPEEELQPEETFEGLPEFQDQDEVPEDPGTIPQGRSAECTRRGHKCYFGICPRGTMSVGSCSTLYRCCKSKPDSENCVGTGGQPGHCYSLTCPRGTVNIGNCRSGSRCCRRI